MNTLKKVLRLIRRYRIQVFFSIYLSAVSMILQLYVPILFGEAIDHISTAGADPKYLVGILAADHKPHDLARHLYKRPHHRICRIKTAHL